MINKYVYITLFVTMLPFAALSQRKPVTGRIVTESYALQGILVVNLQGEREARTNETGMFTLDARPGDTLVITDPGIKTKVVVLDDSYISSVKDIIVEINDTYELDEIVIEQDNKLTSESLGLVPKGQKQYTPAERKLYTAGDFKPIHLVGIIMGGLAVDPIINAINGRTKSLKKAVDVERKEFALEALNGMFTNGEITEHYKIPNENVAAFLYYCVEDAAFAAAVRGGNDTLASFLMSGLATKYLAIISSENDTDEK